MMQLRPYQAEAKDAILQEWSVGHQRTLLVLPTGCGKTVVFAKVTEEQVKKGGRVLIMAHRGELLTQAADKLKAATGLDSVLEKAESSCLGSAIPVTIGSVQSLAPASPVITSRTSSWMKRTIASRTAIAGYLTTFQKQMSWVLQPRPIVAI